MEVTKFTEDHKFGCTYGFDLISGIYLRIWKVNTGLPKYTTIKEYTDMEEWLIFDEFGKSDGLIPEDIQLVLEQHGFHKIGKLNFGILEKQHVVMINAQKEYNEQRQTKTT